MKFNPPIKPFLDYVDLAGHSANEMQSPYLIFNKFKVDTSHTSIPCVTFFLDFSKKKYLHITGSKQLTGFSDTTFFDGGFDLVIDRWNKEDFKVYNDKIFPDLVHFLKLNPIFDSANTIYSCNYRFKTKSGKVIEMLQRTSFIFDPVSGVPLASYGVVTDITHFKQNPGMIYTIESDNGSDRDLLFRKVYFKDDDFSQLSKRETEVLKWMADGLSSKQIADKLKLSIHTINNHRKNMLYKTNCTSSAELVKKVVELSLL